MVQLTISQHWFRQWWVGTDQATIHYLNQCWQSLIISMYSLKILCIILYHVNLNDTWEYRNHMELIQQFTDVYLDGLVQERCNSIANAVELIFLALTLWSMGFCWSYPTSHDLETPSHCYPTNSLAPSVPRTIAVAVSAVHNQNWFFAWAHICNSTFLSIKKHVTHIGKICMEISREFLFV